MVVVSSKPAEGVTVTCAVEEGMVTVTTPPLPFPPVADLVSVAVDEEVCWLDASTVGVTVTCTVEEGTVTVTAFPASVWELVEIDSKELASTEISSDEGWLGVVKEVAVDDKKPVTLIFPPFSVLVPEAAVTSVDVRLVSPEDPAFTVLFACVLVDMLVGSFLLVSSAVELEVASEEASEVSEATFEDVTDCSVDPVAELVEDTFEGDSPDGPNELKATVSTTEP